jgi:hypothetical protein
MTGKSCVRPNPVRLSRVALGHRHIRGRLSSPPSTLRGTSFTSLPFAPTPPSTLSNRYARQRAYRQRCWQAVHPQLFCGRRFPVDTPSRLGCGVGLAARVDGMQRGGNAIIATGSSGLIGHAAFVQFAQAAAYAVAGFDRPGTPHPPPEAGSVPCDLTSDGSAFVRDAVSHVRRQYGRRVASVAGAQG